MRELSPQGPALRQPAERHVECTQTGLPIATLVAGAEAQAWGNKTPCHDAFWQQQAAAARGETSKGN